MRGAPVRLAALLVVAVVCLSGCQVRLLAEPKGTAPVVVQTDRGHGLTIDADVFAYREDVGVSNEVLRVVSDSGEEKVVRALAAAGARFMMVDEHGREYQDEAALESAAEADLYTPNYVSDPKVTADGVELYVDCKGAVEEPMAATFRKVLREELEAAGIRGTVRAVTS
ncbi:hypothetical protein GCM10027517_14490 [Phycicoccus ginsengisoli]